VYCGRYVVIFSSHEGEKNGEEYGNKVAHWSCWVNIMESEEKMKSIGLIGDAIIDNYLYCTTKFNPENKGPCYKILRREQKWGGVKNVEENLVKLGSKVDCFYPVVPLSVKTRVICDGKYVCRIDGDEINKNKDWFSCKNTDAYDYVVVSDYLKGAITKKLARNLCSGSAKVIVDTKPEHAKWFKGAHLLKVNQKEADEIFNKMKMKDFDRVVITKGAEGLDFFDGEYEWGDCSASNGTCVDVTGAGDTVLATLAWSLNRGDSLLKACGLANKAGSIAVQHLGCYAVSEKELME